MATDTVTYNAAFSAAFACFKANLTDTTAGDYAPLSTAATAFATEVDAAVTAAGGSGANANRGNLMQCICQSVIGAGYLPAIPNSGTAASYSAIANAVAAAYTNAKAGLV